MTAAGESRIGRAGAKVILLGEHAVVHGTPAIAIGLRDRTEIAARFASGPTALEVAPWGLCARVDGSGTADAALRDLFDALGAPFAGVALAGTTALPARAGLGASASVAAAAARAVCGLLGREPSFAELHAAVQASERSFHGNPSGIDAAAVLAPGVMRYSRARGVEPLDLAAPELVIVRTDDPGDTRVTVAAFAARLEAEPAEGKRRLEAIRAIVEAGGTALARRDLAALGRLLDENHEQLAWFGVSTAALDRACAAARSAGALGAKLTGGGGGGCAIALVRPGERALVSARLAVSGFTLVPA
jgi:mevalonate kinase